MISNEEQQMIGQLIESNPEFKTAFNKLSDENRLILSRFTHEIRNPLTLVKSTVQLIESQHPEVSEFKYWPQLISDIDDTIELLNQLSVYNHCDQLQSGKEDLIDIISDTIASAKAYAASKQIELYFTYDDDPAFHNYICDRTKLKELFMNLIKNAVEAAFESTPIQIRLSNDFEPKTNGHYINISITNTGIPIPSDNLMNIFDPFVTYKPNGTGLGLAICKKIAHMHKGEISVSQTDGAITFSIQLPNDVLACEPLYIAL